VQPFKERALEGRKIQKSRATSGTQWKGGEREKKQRDGKRWKEEKGRLLLLEEEDFLPEREKERRSKLDGGKFWVRAFLPTENSVGTWRYSC